MGKEHPHEDSTESGSISYDDKWITKFLEEKKHRFLCRVNECYLEDRFNLYGLKDKMEDFDDAYSSILDMRRSTKPHAEATLYYLVHQRYIYTKGGLQSVCDKAMNKEFGTCFRVGCDDISLLPVGLSNEPGKFNTMLYCYNCNNLFRPRGSIRDLDGSAWGTGFAHFFLLSYSYLFKKKPFEIYVPRIFGFRIADPDDYDSM